MSCWCTMMYHMQRQQTCLPSLLYFFWANTSVELGWEPARCWGKLHFYFFWANTSVELGWEPARCWGKAHFFGRANTSVKLGQEPARCWGKLQFFFYLLFWVNTSVELGWEPARCWGKLISLLFWANTSVELGWEPARCWGKLCYFFFWFGNLLELLACTSFLLHDSYCMCIHNFISDPLKSSAKALWWGFLTCGNLSYLSKTHMHVNLAAPKE